ncbi:hypothetical protein PG993_001694 [Apiospora rasikravindrae]|uniref:Uncharacterized protein n=1 Tax=Apiospora rasikravindrae TaxID=990691 RepID=A0ABR1UCN1_9PEZI
MGSTSSLVHRFSAASECKARGPRVVDERADTRIQKAAVTRSVLKSKIMKRTDGTDDIGRRADVFANSNATIYKKRLNPEKRNTNIGWHRPVPLENP